MNKKIREYSVPLILGVIISLVFANVSPELYDNIINTPIIGDDITLKWLVKDILMVFFFGIAGAEIVNSFSHGGPLNPINKAITPLFATAGGVIGPVVCFFIINAVIGQAEYLNGWGITTATDIALAWLIAKIVFGKGHPAVSFLLLLAVIDDAIGLIIIAVFYPDPSHPTELIWLLLIVAGLIIAFIMRKKHVQSATLYVIIPGLLAWFGLYNAGLHPSLALVFIVPFMPNVGSHTFVGPHGPAYSAKKTTLHRFEHGMSPIVDYGLFFFGFANAGVEFSAISSLTWTIMLALIVGKTVGITLFSLITNKVFKIPLPEGMKAKDVVIAGVIAGMGLTVALFVCTSAFTDAGLQGAAKMGALFTIAAAPIAILLGKVLKVERVN